MDASTHIKLISVPGANDVHLGLGEPHASACAIFGDDFLDLGDHFALAGRPAHMRAEIEIGKKLAIKLEHRDLEAFEGDHPAPGICELRGRADIHLLHWIVPPHGLVRLNHIETSHKLSPPLRISALTVTTMSVGVRASGVIGRTVRFSDSAFAAKSRTAAVMTRSSSVSDTSPRLPEPSARSVASMKSEPREFAFVSGEIDIRKYPALQQALLRPLAACASPRD